MMCYDAVLEVWILTVIAYESQIHPCCLGVLASGWGTSASLCSLLDGI